MAISRSHHRILAWLQPSMLTALAVLTGGTFASELHAQTPPPRPAAAPTPAAPPSWATNPYGPAAPAAKPAAAPTAAKPAAAATAPKATTAKPPADDSDDDERTPAEPFDAEKERAETLVEQANLLGSTGLLRTAIAGSGAEGTFRVGFLADWFSSSGFLCNSSTPCEPTASSDTSSHIGGWFSVNATPLPWLEAYAGIRTYANSNSLGTPQLLQVLGDSTIGVKAFTPDRIGDLATFGGDLRVMLLNGAGDVGVAGSGTSMEINALASLDFRKLGGRGMGAPVRMHLNAGYFLNNSGELVADVEALRAQRNPSLAGDLGRLPISRIERFGLGINRVDFFPIRFGVDAPLGWVQPYLEYSIDIPFNRQGYECHTRTIAEGDVCLALTDLSNPNSGAPGFAAAPSRVSVGARTNPFDGTFRGLSGHVAFDIGTSGTSKFIEEVAPQAPWTLYVGMGYAYDTVEKKKVEVKAAPPPTPTVEVVPPPAEYFVRGIVKEKGAAAMVASAIVSVRDPGVSDPPYATDGNGRFLTRKLEPGVHTFEVVAEGYKTATCSTTIVAATPAASAAAAAPAKPAGAPAPAAPATAPAPKSYVTGSFYTEVTCEVEALPRKGSLSGSVSGSDNNAPLAGATVVFTDAKGASLSATTGPNGTFSFADVPPGEGKIKVEHPAHFGQVQDVAIRPREEAKAGIILTKRPATASVKVAGNQIQIKKQIHFETDSAVIKADSNQLLEEIADVIKTRATGKSIEIQGHTDNTGTAATNKDLSQKRADSVRTWLIERGGVEADRLTAKGYGQERPLVPNVTPANRARNRRVQLVILGP